MIEIRPVVNVKCNQSSENTLVEDIEKLNSYFFSICNKMIENCEIKLRPHESRRKEVVSILDLSPARQTSRRKIEM